ncbi:hypothetical protein KAR91_66785 [Candidatus Pacearchaeota archaeon]|nr:hypothetical protein [Candidatus Pacearchaeota archaeon]
MSDFKDNRDLLLGVPITIIDDSVIISGLDLKQMNIDGFSSLQVITSGPGSLEVQWLGSNLDVLEYYKKTIRTGGIPMESLTLEHPASSETYEIAGPITALGAVQLIAIGTVIVEKLIWCVK